MTDVRALKDKASQLSMKGKHDAALDAWKAVVASAPEDVASQQKVAETLIKLNRKGDAVKVYEDVAQGYAQKGLFFKASAVCRLVLGLDPQHQRTLELISSLYAKNKAPVPSSKPAPARMMTTNTVFLPSMTGDFIRASGVSISTSWVGMSRVTS